MAESLATPSRTVTTVVTGDACLVCERPLTPVHGHWACYTPGCQMWGMNQVPCCEGAPCPVK